MSPERRSAAAKKANAVRSPEKRRAAALKGHGTRAANRHLANTHVNPAPFVQLRLPIPANFGSSNRLTADGSGHFKNTHDS